jgi:hypothetical protein
MANSPQKDFVSQPGVTRILAGLAWLTAAKGQFPKL